MIIGLCQQTAKVECMYLAFKNLKVSSEIGEHCSKT